MSSASDTAVMLLSICDAPEAVAPLLALAEVDRPTTWSPAPAMSASLSLTEALPFAKKGVGYAIMVASAPDPSGQVLRALSKFTQKGVWRRMARNSDCDKQTVITLLDRDDNETLEGVVEYTDPRFWTEWMEEKQHSWLSYHLVHEPDFNSSPRWARTSASRFLPKWSKDECLEFISTVLDKPIGKTWVVEALRVASYGNASVNVDEILPLLPYSGMEKFMVLAASLNSDSVLTDAFIDELVDVAPQGQDPNRVHPGLPGPAATDDQVLRLLATDSEYVKAIAMESVLAHPDKYHRSTVNAVLSDAYVSTLKRSWVAVKCRFHSSIPEWAGFHLLDSSTIDTVVLRTGFLNDPNRYGGVAAEEMSFAGHLSRPALKRLLAASTVMEWVPWLCGSVAAFDPEFALLLETLQEYGDAGKSLSVDEVRQMLGNNQTLHRITPVPTLTGEVTFHEEALKLVDFLGKAAILYAATNLTGYAGSYGTVVLAAVQEVISRAQPHPEAWSVIASLAPTWTGSITELVDTANAMYSGYASTS